MARPTRRGSSTGRDVYGQVFDRLDDHDSDTLSMNGTSQAGRHRTSPAEAQRVASASGSAGATSDLRGALHSLKDKYTVVDKCLRQVRTINERLMHEERDAKNHPSNGAHAHRSAPKHRPRQEVLDDIHTCLSIVRNLLSNVSPNGELSLPYRLSDSPVGADEAATLIPILKATEKALTKKQTKLHLAKLGIRAVHPDLFETWYFLSELKLSDNSLYELPPEIDRLANLTVLYLSDNELAVLPPEIGVLPALEFLYLRNNRLTELPSNIGALVSLHGLSVQNNQLTSLPDECANLTNLMELNIADNHLRVFPEWVLDLPYLEQLFFDGNDFDIIPADLIAAKLERRHASNAGRGRGRLVDEQGIWIGELGMSLTGLVEGAERSMYHLAEHQKAVKEINRLKAILRDELERRKEVDAQVKSLEAVLRARDLTITALQQEVADLGREAQAAREREHNSPLIAENARLRENVSALEDALTYEEESVADLQTQINSMTATMQNLEREREKSQAMASKAASDAVEAERKRRDLERSPSQFATSPAAQAMRADDLEAQVDMLRSELAQERALRSQAQSTSPVVYLSDPSTVLVCSRCADEMRVVPAGIDAAAASSKRAREAAEIERAEADALAEEERVAAREAATREAARQAAELAASLDGGPLDITALGTDGKPTGGRRGHVSFELEGGEASPGADDAGSGGDNGGGSSNRSVEYNDDGGDSHNGVDEDDINDGAYLRRKQMFSQPHEAVRSIEALRAALRSGSSQALVENLAGIMGQDVKLTVPGDGRARTAGGGGSGGTARVDDDEETMSRSSMLVYNGGADELKSNILLSESLGNTLAQVLSAFSDTGMDSPKSAAALLREHKSFMETTTNANLSDSENAEERKRKITKIESELRAIVGNARDLARTDPKFRHLSIDLAKQMDDWLESNKRLLYQEDRAVEITGTHRDTDPELGGSEESPAIVYEIRVSVDGDEWMTEHAFKEFKTLKRVLLSNVQEEMDAEDALDVVSSLPFDEPSAPELQEYLRSLCLHDFVWRSVFVQDFLAADYSWWRICYEEPTA